MTKENKIQKLIHDLNTISGIYFYNHNTHPFYNFILYQEMRYKTYAFKGKNGFLSRKTISLFRNINSDFITLVNSIEDEINQ